VRSSKENPSGLRFVSPPATDELRSSVVSTAIGDVVLIGSRDVLVKVELPGDGGAARDENRPDADDATLTRAATQLREYFDGERQEFSLDVAPSGTAFQTTVWKRLAEIPYGTTKTYGQIAAEVGNAKASRAVGMANNRNPIALFIPCHRVIGASGALVGYGGGLEAKELLLDLERKVAERES
jgi:methylated-DNA-[protein]-cysteine S-methyltransferase